MDENFFAVSHVDGVLWIRHLFWLRIRRWEALIALTLLDLQFLFETNLREKLIFEAVVQGIRTGNDVSDNQQSVCKFDFPVKIP